MRVSYLQPAETRPEPDRGDRDHARRGAVLRPVLPARQQRRAAADASLRRPRELPRPARAGPDAGAGGGRPLQRHRRLPRRDRARPRDPLRLPHRRPGSTSPGCSATPTRTAPRPRRSRASTTRTRSAPGWRTSPTWSPRSTATGPRSGSARPSRCWSRTSTGPGADRPGHVEGRAAHQGPEVDGSTFVSGLTGWESDAADRRAGARRGGRERRGRPDRGSGRRASDERRRTDAGTGRDAEQLEPPQRPHHAADRLGPVLRLGAARRRRRLDHLAHHRLGRSSSWRWSPTRSTATSRASAT